MIVALTTLVAGTQLALTAFMSSMIEHSARWSAGSRCHVSDHVAAPDP